MDEKASPNADEALGLNAPIERRDLLNSTLIAAGAALLQSVAPFKLLAEEDWTGYGGVGDYATSNGNTHSVMSADTRSATESSTRPPPQSPIPERSTIAW